MFTIAVSSGVILAGLRMLLAQLRGDVPNIVVPLRWLAVAAACFGLQVYLARGAGLEFEPAVRTGLIWSSHALVALAALANVRRPSMVVLFAGLMLNLVVMAANGGLMPVSPGTLVRAGHSHVLDRVSVGEPMPKSKDIILAADQTRLAFLSDTLVLPGRKGSFSAGDVLIAAGAFLVLQGSVVVRGQRSAGALPIVPKREVQWRGV